MVFKNNIPQPTNLLSNSQGDLLGNMAQLDTTMGINHYNFSDLTANNGKHKCAEFVIQGGIPGSQAVGEATLYSQAVQYSVVPNVAVSELYMSRDNLGIPIQLTTGKTGDAGTTNTNVPQSLATGVTWLPGGLLLMWSSFNPNASVFVTFPFGGFKNNCFNIQLTAAQSDNSSYRLSIIRNSLAKTGFTFGGSVDTHWTPIYYIAIGN